MKKINKNPTIEKINYNEDKKEIIVDYKEENEIKRFVFSVSEKLNKDQQTEIIRMVGKSFIDLKNWILDNNVLEKISEDNNKIGLSFQEFYNSLIKNGEYFNGTFSLATKKNEKIVITDETKIKNVYLDLRNGYCIYDYKHQISGFMKIILNT
ncbi:hypothetical protein [Candidatus Ruminimicrobium bovinum]|uniref:hypothetical protein n=1 Tax=Candidatus Ruminimicrobium bovinum TaxID=3242779 RepID=UPI0039B9B6BE